MKPREEDGPTQGHTGSRQQLGPGPAHRPQAPTLQPEKQALGPLPTARSGPTVTAVRLGSPVPRPSLPAQLCDHQGVSSPLWACNPSPHKTRAPHLAALCSGSSRHAGNGQAPGKPDQQPLLADRRGVEQPPKAPRSPLLPPAPPTQTPSAPQNLQCALPQPVTQQRSRAPHQEMGTMAREALLSRTKALGSWEPERLRASVPREIVNL